jgi:hypothetical protein
MPTTSPKLFQNPAVGFPSRIESTPLPGTVTRQLSHVTGWRIGNTTERVGGDRDGMPPPHLSLLPDLDLLPLG